MDLILTDKTKRILTAAGWCPDRNESTANHVVDEQQLQAGHVKCTATTYAQRGTPQTVPVDPDSSRDQLLESLRGLTIVGDRDVVIVFRPGFELGQETDPVRRIIEEEDAAMEHALWSCLSETLQCHLAPTAWVVASDALSIALDPDGVVYEACWPYFEDGQSDAVAGRVADNIGTFLNFWLDTCERSIQDALKFQAKWHTGVTLQQSQP